MILMMEMMVMLLGRCNSGEDHSEVTEKTDDWLWMKLRQITFADDDPEKLTLPQLQYMLLDQYGKMLQNLCDEIML